MLRWFTPFILLPLPVLAWEATPGPICTLVHDEPGLSVRLTYDPRIPEYTITLTRPAPWPDAPVFALRFDGPRGDVITTDRHVLGDGGMSLTVTDRGFGNVLNGLALNERAMAMVGDQTVGMSLSGAAPAVEAFRACETAPSV